MIKKIFGVIIRRKIISGIILIVVAVGGYYAYKSLAGSSAITRYALAAVEKGTLVVSVSGSGQVSASDQVDMKSKVSGDVVYVGVKSGQEVKAGTLIAQLNPADAQKTVRDAQINLDNAKIQLEKMQLNQGTDLSKLQNDVETAENNLTKTYEDAYNTIANVFLQLPSTIEGMRAILYDATVGEASQFNIGAYQDMVNDRLNSDFMINKRSAENDYLVARDLYTQNFTDYKKLSRTSSHEEIEKLAEQTLETVRSMSQAVKSEQNLLDYVVDNFKTYQSRRPVPSAITGYQSNIAQYIGQLNSNISSLSNIQDSIRNSNLLLTTSKQNLEYNQKFSPLDIEAQEYAITQKEAALQDAQDNLANFYIRAPFSGVVAKINIKKGDTLSNGAAVATVITKQHIAEITLNEIDVAKVKNDQKTTLTFDAVENLTITGTVIELDSLGTVNQGVVTYSVVIGFDTQDDRIKPGMTVSASVITDAKQNVLLVPNSAIKYSDGINYVEIPNDVSDPSQLLANAANSSGVSLDTTPEQKTIEIGVANDSVTEIISGLQEGDIVITRTITATSDSQTSTQGNSLFPVTGRGAGGGEFRTPIR